MIQQSPFPWFGGKSRVAADVWRAFGKIDNYVEPFFGSGAVLLGRPDPRPIETVNDKDGFIANFWRAIAADPEAVAEFADWPVNENDLHARHVWLVGQAADLAARLEGDPHWCDAKIAGWWVWGICSWIGGEFCSGKGPWRISGGKLVRLGNAGQGVHRKLVHLGNAGQGVHRRRVHLGGHGGGVGVHRKRASLVEWFADLSARLHHVRVCSGDWSRVCGPTPTFKHGVTAVFLDPPYPASADREASLYRVDDLSIAADVRDWAVEAGRRADMKIAMCGYDGSLEMPPDWRVVGWKAKGGYGTQAENSRGRANAGRERIWFSHACADPRQGCLI